VVGSGATVTVCCTQGVALQYGVCPASSTVKAVPLSVLGILSPSKIPAESVSHKVTVYVPGNV
jgi:hypothetical protein